MFFNYHFEVRFWYQRFAKLCVVSSPLCGCIVVSVRSMIVDAESRRVRTEWRASLIRMPLRVTHITP